MVIIESTGSFREYARQHEDLVTVLSILLGMLVACIGSLKALNFFSLGIIGLMFPDFWGSYPLNVKEIIVLILAFLVSSSILAWVIRIKNRTLWFMLLLLVPVGWIGFVFIQDRSRIHEFGLKYWKKLRQLLCWLGIILLITWAIIAMNWNLPMTGNYTVIYGDVYWGVQEEVKPAKNYSEAPFLVQLGGNTIFFTVVTAGMLFYGTLKK